MGDVRSSGLLTYTVEGTPPDHREALKIYEEDWDTEGSPTQDLAYESKPRTTLRGSEKEACASNPVRRKDI